MNQSEIKDFLDNSKEKQERTIVIVDFGNVEKWKNTLKWRVGIRELGVLVKNFSIGKKFLMRKTKKLLIMFYLQMILNIG